MINWKFICFILIILFFIKLNYKSTFGSSGISAELLYNGDDWGEYRLGDVYYQPLNSEYYSEDFYDNLLSHKTNFKGSIANEYINKNKSTNQNKKLLHKIIESKIIDKNIYPETLFLHIRVGDVICDKSTSWLKSFNAPLHYSRLGDTDWWDTIIKYINTNKINTVVIISGTHLKKCLKESSKYIENRAKFLKNKVSNLKIIYRLGKSPDEDILTCYYVKHFISTGGNYGRMIDEIKIKYKE